MSVLERWLAHPLTRGLDPDDPETTRLRRTVIASKPFLRQIYLEWYRRLIAAAPTADGELVELGSGAGFFSELCPEVVTTEVFFCDGIKAVVDARKLPFATGSLRSIVMTDVMHHIPDVEQFFAEAQRVLRPAGRILMIEPWVSAWSRLIYTRFHPEPFRPEASTWTFPSAGPLSGANGALPWIVLVRDRSRFETLYPALRLVRTEAFMPFRYLLSGGVSMRALAPGWSFAFFTRLESLLRPCMGFLAMFAFIEIERV